MIIETPAYKYSETINIIIHFNLLKVTGNLKDESQHECQKLTSSYMIIKYSLNSVC